MKTEIRIDGTEPEPRALILTPEMTEEVVRAVRLLETGPYRRLAGYRDSRAELLDPGTISRIRADGDNVLADTLKGTCRLRLRLYEVEQRLDPRQFVRISRSELINLDQVQSFDLRMSGTIEVRMQDGCCSYVARRYVKKIREELGV